MARKTKQQALETRCHIIDAAIKCFSERGVSSTSLADVASAAGVTRGAIYWHFKNKPDLINEIWLQCDAGLEELELEYQAKYPGDPLSVVRSMLIFVLQATVNDPRRRALMEIIFHKCEYVGEMTALMNLQQSLLQECYERIETILRECMEAGLLPEDLNARQAAIIMRGYISGLMESWLFKTDSFDLYTQAPALVDCFLDMLRFSPALRVRDRPVSPC